jgi:anti-sigma B factor antagonist
VTGFHADVQMIEETAVVRLHGDIDRRAADGVPDAYERAVANEPSAVLLDFGDVGFINSTGIALLVGLLARARSEGRDVKACGLSDHYLRIFQITRLADLMQLYPDAASALGPSGAAPAHQSTP